MLHGVAPRVTRPAAAALPPGHCRTGGLADTVFDVDAKDPKANGFVFNGADDKSLSDALDRALKMYT